MQTKIILRLLIISSLTAVLFGILLKIMHWPYQALFLYAGSSGTLFFYTIYLAIKPKRHILDYVRFVLIICWLSNVLFSLHHWYYAGQIQLATKIISLVWIVAESAVFFKINRQSKWQRLASFVLISLSGLSILVGAILKLMHSAMAGILILVGLGGLVFYAFFEYLFNNHSHNH